ncbi:hypothetical protein CLV57_1306 [Mucilaginibacter auburnensis]|uniref:Uncharacterized protein n=1 Tax=Mucilaginibacter auburnensis TaxID=1457233 RepID=A0A2H9VU07_9SPHI|nr:hypothetical protein CLV57_1306 [Mucilaginibacter auburnensis]
MTNKQSTDRTAKTKLEIRQIDLFLFDLKNEAAESGFTKKFLITCPSKLVTE